MLSLDSSQDKIPEQKGAVDVEFPAKEASKPSHELELWRQLIPHQMAVESLINAFKELVVYAVAFLHDD